MSYNHSKPKSLGSLPRLVSKVPLSQHGEEYHLCIIIPLPWELEAEDIKKKGQEYTEELYKKDLNDPDNHDGVVIHLEPDILE